MVERVAKARQVGRADAVLLSAMQHLHPIVLPGESIGDLAGAVGRAVVDDEYTPTVGRGGAQRFSRGSDDRLDVLGLVVRGEDQPGSQTWVGVP